MREDENEKFINEFNKKLDNKTFELEKAEEVIFDYDKVNYDQNELIENQKKRIFICLLSNPGKCLGFSTVFQIQPPNV